MAGTMRQVRGTDGRYHLQDAPLRECWVTVAGLQVGKPFDPRTYDEKQLPPPEPKET